MDVVFFVSLDRAGVDPDSVEEVEVVEDVEIEAVAVGSLGEVVGVGTVAAEVELGSG